MPGSSCSASPAMGRVRRSPPRCAWSGCCTNGSGSTCWFGNRASSTWNAPMQACVAISIRSKPRNAAFSRIWSASAECRPLFVYAKASHGGARPLTMAGFDMQLDGARHARLFRRGAARFRRQVEPRDADPGRKRSPTACSITSGVSTATPTPLATKAAELGRAGITGAAQGAALRDWDKAEGDALRPVAEDLDRPRRGIGRAGAPASRERR